MNAVGTGKLLEEVHQELMARVGQCNKSTEDLIRRMREIVVRAYEIEAKPGRVVSPDAPDMSEFCDLMKFRVNYKKPDLYDPCVRDKCCHFEDLGAGVVSCAPRRAAIKRFLEQNPEIPEDDYGV